MQKKEKYPKKYERKNVVLKRSECAEIRCELFDNDVALKRAHSNHGKQGSVFWSLITILLRCIAQQSTYKTLSRMISKSPACKKGVSKTLK